MCLGCGALGSPVKDSLAVGACASRPDSHLELKYSIHNTTLAVAATMTMLPDHDALRKPL